MNNANITTRVSNELQQRLAHYLAALHLQPEVRQRVSDTVQNALAHWSAKNPNASEQARYDQLWQLLDATLCQVAEQKHPSQARLALNAQAQQLDVHSRRQSNSRLWSAPKLKRRSMRPSGLPEHKASAAQLGDKISH